MIDVLAGKIKIMDREEAILRYEVWWTVPGKGLTQDPPLEHAVFYSTPVAVSETLYEVLPPEIVS